MAGNYIIVHDGTEKCEINSKESFSEEAVVQQNNHYQIRDYIDVDSKVMAIIAGGILMFIIASLYVIWIVLDYIQIPLECNRVLSK